MRCWCVFFCGVCRRLLVLQCAVPYNCKDWPHRFEVAKKAREEKYDVVF